MDGHVLRTYFVLAVVTAAQIYLTSSQTTTKPLHTAPMFVSEPQDTVAEPASTVTLRCDATGNPPPVFAWNKDGAEIDIASKTHLTLTATGDLVINQFDVTEDVGKYQCVATTSDSFVRLKILSRPASVIATVSPSAFQQQPLPTTGFVGGAVRLGVGIGNALPTPDIVWKYRGKSTILSSDSRFTVLPQGVMVIKGLQSSDEGEIRAIARLSNGQYVNSDYVKVDVKAAADRPLDKALYFIGKPQDVALTWGKSTILECSADSSTATTVTWLKDGNIVQYDARISLFGGSHLKLSYVTEAESGLYTCEVKGGSQTIQASATVTVQVAPTFALVPSKQYGRVDGSVTFQYKVQGNPKPEISWYKDGLKVSSTADFLVAKEGSLTVTAIISNDAGMYQVFASSPVGVAQATAELVVLERGVVIPTTPTQPSITPTAASLKPGKVKNVNGYSTSPTTVTVAWQKPDITNGDIQKYVVVYLSSLTAAKSMIVTGSEFSATLTGLEPSTTYDIRLQAVNQFGGGALSSTVKVTTPQQTPGKIPSLTTTAPTPDSVYVSWPKPTSGSVITKYILYFIDVTNSPQTILSRETTSTSLLINALRPDTTYKFWVVPHNGDIEGPKSEEYTTTTPKAAVSKPGAVGNLVASAASPSIITLTWDAPKSGDAVTKYEVTVLNADEPSSPADKRTTSTTTAFLTGLKPDTNYKVSVVPYSGIVVGPPSVPLLTKTPADVPSSSPSGFTPGTVTDNTALLRWAPLTKAQANGAVVSYQLRLRIAGKKDSSKTIDIPAPANQYLLSGLDPSTSYVLRLAAVTSAGAGPFGDQLRFATKASSAGKVPTAPLNFKGTPLINSPGIVTLSWQPPVEANGVVTRYSIVKVTTTGAWTEMTTDGSVLALNVSNLPFDSNNAFQIFATNQFGDGAKSNPIMVTTMKETQHPGTPNDLAFKSTKSSLTINWQPPLDTSTVVRGYEVTVRKTSTMEVLFTKSVMGRLNTHLHVTDKIEPGTEYAIGVVAVNNFGASSLTEGVAWTNQDQIVSIKKDFLSVGAREIVFNWTDSRQALVPTYVVRYSPQKAHSGQDAMQMQAVGNMARVVNLRPWTYYRFYVRRNIDTAFSAVPFLVVKTKPAPPSRPLDLTMVADGNTWFVLSWQTPIYPNGVITNYVILYTTDDAHHVGQRIVVPTPDDSLFFNVTGLTVGTRYYFNIIAVNVAGRGQRSHTFTGDTTGAKIPGGFIPLAGAGGGMAGSLWWIILAIILFILLLLLILLLIYCCCCRAGGCLCCESYCPCCWACWLACCLPCCLFCCPCCCRKHKKTKKHEQHLYVAAPVNGSMTSAATYHGNGYSTLDMKTKNAPPDLWVSTANGNAMEMTTHRANGGLDLTMQSGGTASMRSSSHSLNKAASLSGASGIKVAIPGDSTFISYKTSLQDYCQKIGWLPPNYATQQYKGGFTGTATFAGQSYSSGGDYGTTRIDAEQRAAFAALISLGALMNGCKYNAAANIAVPSPGETSFISYKCSLHDFCQQCNILPPRFMTSKQSGMYASQVQVGSHTFSMDAVVTSRQDAEQQVAFAALKGLCMTETGSQYNPNACFTVAGPGTNRFVSFKSSLDDFCQQYKLPPPQYITTQTVQGYSAKLKFGGLFFQSNDYLPTRLESEQHAAYEALQGLGLLESSVQFGSGDTERIGHGSTLSVNSVGQARTGGGSRYGSSSQLSQSSHASESFAYRTPQLPRAQFGSSDITSGYVSGDGGVPGHTRVVTSYSTSASPAVRLRSSSFDANSETGPNTANHQRSFSSSTSYQQTNVRNVHTTGRTHDSARYGLSYRQPGLPASRSHRVYGSASHVNEYSSPSYFETRSVSHPALSDLENEMAGLEGLIRDLNGITSSEKEKETYA